MARTIKADYPRNFRIHGFAQSETIRAYNVCAAKEIFCKQFNDKVIAWQELNSLGQVIYNGPLLSKIAKRFGHRYVDGVIIIVDDHGKSNAIVEWLEDHGYEFTNQRGNGRTAPTENTYLEFRMW